MTEFKLSLRVPDVDAASRFYGGLGFESEGVVPDPDGRPVLASLRRGPVYLILDALVGLPFPDSERERSIRRGPRGLGVVVGIGVDDLEAAYAYCTGGGCEITCEPMDEAWGERVFTCLDPFGYELEFFTPLPAGPPEDPTAAVRESWFGAEMDVCSNPNR
jgi:uncharacterized glyoxalase superfamily protein PhnB